MVWGELFLHCEEQLSFACFRAPDHPTQSFRSREQRLEKSSSRMAAPWGLPRFEMGLSRSADLIPAVGLVLKPSQTSPGLHSAAVGWVAAWGALAVGPVLEQQEIIFAWAVAAGLSFCKLLLCGRACAHTSVVANMGCSGQSMKNSGCSFLHGKGSFEQRCIFRICRAFLWRIKVLWHCKTIAEMSLFKNRAMLRENYLYFMQRFDPSVKW